MNIRIKNSNIFIIPTDKPEHRFLHLATLATGIIEREFWILLCYKCPGYHPVYAPDCSFSECKHDQHCYIEERNIFGGFDFIKEDDLALELARFAESNNLTDITTRANEIVEIGLGYLIFRDK